MKIPLNRRPTRPKPKLEDENEPLDIPMPQLEKVSIDISIPRECVYKALGNDPGPCPRCGGQLRQSHQTYMIVTKHGDQSGDSFITNGDMGWFCLQCPTVVINTEELSRMFQVQLPHWNVGPEFAVAGIVDLDAIPKEKEHLPLGADGNPIPLVLFTNYDGAAIAREYTPSGRRRRPKSKVRRR
jgi:hypothetical protein